MESAPQRVCAAPRAPAQGAICARRTCAAGRENRAARASAGCACAVRPAAAARDPISCPSSPAVNRSPKSPTKAAVDQTRSSSPRREADRSMGGAAVCGAVPAASSASRRQSMAPAQGGSAGIGEVGLQRRPSARRETVRHAVWGRGVRVRGIGTARQYACEAWHTRGLRSGLEGRGDVAAHTQPTSLAASISSTSVFPAGIGS